MGSKGRIPPPHLRRPLPGHPDPYGLGIHPTPFDMMPPPEVLEQKLAAQHVEMQKLAFENQRLAATHGTLRQELAAAQHELQILHAQIGAVKSEREQQMRGLMDKIAKMEAEVQTAEPVKLELQQARSDAQNLVVVREELISKVRQLGQDLQRTHSDVQQIPTLVLELDGLRQEYQRCRETYDYEKKFYNDHIESLQVMEKNYITMAREVEKLRAELTNPTNLDRRTGGPYGGTTATNENEASVHPAGQNAYEDAYGVPQGHGSVPAAAGATPPAYAGTQSYEASKGAGYDTMKGPGYDASRGPGYDTQRMPAAYEKQRASGYNVQRGSGYDALVNAGYDAQARGGVHGQLVPPPTNVPYGSATPPAHPGGGFELSVPRPANPARR